MAHIGRVYDTDNRFTIDANTRLIKNEMVNKTSIVQFDHNSERFSFELPRYIDGHDMSECNNVEVHYLNVSSETKQTAPGVYIVDDLQISPNNQEKVVCSWLISSGATIYAGILTFLIRYECRTGNVLDYAWNTAPHSEIYVTKGLYSSKDVLETYVDVIEQWKDSVMQTFAAEITAWKKEKAEELEADLSEWKEAEKKEVQQLFGDYTDYWDNQIAIERARIDQFVALKDGSTSGDAELQDIRVGANGKAYESAGAAVREQFADVGSVFTILGDFERDTSAWKPVNVIEGFSWGDAGCTYDDYGNIVSTEYTTQFTPLTQLVPAIPGASYQFAGFVGQVRIYAADKTQLDLIYNNAMSNQLTFTAPDEAALFGIYYRHDIIDTEERIAAIKLYRTTMTDREYLSCPVVMVGNRVSFKPLLDKTIVNFGDSIFGNARPPDDISTYLANLTGATVHNCGFGGCRMSYHPSANYDAFSMTKLADAVANNDFSLQEAAVTSIEGDKVPGYFADGVEVLKSIDFSKVDIITIAYGANDFNGVTLDNESNPISTRTFAGALRYSIETILAAYPHIRIFVCSPTYRFWMDSNYAFTEDSDTKMGGAYYLTTDIVKKAKEVAEEYKLPYIDNYYSLGINKFNRVQYFPTTDGAHHNVNGRKLIAEHIAKGLF